MEKIIIAGSRHYQDYPHLCQICKQEITTRTEIVSGGARGADQLGELYAKLQGHQLKRFLPDWAKYGKAAGPIRNQLMADYADRAILSWDGRSRGTQHLICVLQKRQKPYLIIHI
ncbi:MAG: SLOG family protein [Bacteroidota bacterium]